MTSIFFDNYQAVRPLLRDGDVAFFSHHKVGDKLIKWWEGVADRNDGDNYSHVGTVMTMGQRIFLLEASFNGGVRMVPLSLRQPNMVVSMGLVWNQQAEDFAMENLGMKYGLWEAIKAAVGLRETDDDKFICTEYVAKITDLLGYELPNVKQLPSNFFNQLAYSDKTMMFINFVEETKIA